MGGEKGEKTKGSNTTCQVVRKWKKKGSEKSVRVKGQIFKQGGVNRKIPCLQGEKNT